MGNCLNWLSTAAPGEASAAGLCSISSVASLLDTSIRLFKFQISTFCSIDAPRKVKVGNYNVKVLGLRGQGGFSDVFEVQHFKNITLACFGCYDFMNR